MSNELGQILGDNIRDKENIKPQLGARERYYTYLIMKSAEIDVQHLKLVVSTRTIEDSFILGHPTAANSMLGTAKLGDNRSAFTETIHRYWQYNSTVELGEGTSSANINLNNDQITIK